MHASLTGRALGRRRLRRQERTHPDRRSRHGIPLTVFIDPRNDRLTIAQVANVGHQIREARLGGQREPGTLRGLVRRLGAASEVGDLRPRSHRVPSTTAAALVATAAASSPGAESPAARGLTRFRVAVVDRRVLVDSWLKTYGSKPNAHLRYRDCARRSIARTSALLLIWRTMYSRSDSTA